MGANGNEIIIDQEKLQDDINNYLAREPFPSKIGLQNAIGFSQGRIDKWHEKKGHRKFVEMLNKAYRLIQEVNVRRAIEKDPK